MRCKASDCFTCQYPDCINDYVGTRKPLSENAKMRVSEYRKERRAAFEKAALCTSCGKNKPSLGYKRCTACRTYDKQKKLEYRLRDGKLIREMMDGITLCVKCGKAAPMSGYKMCKACIAQANAALDKTPTHNGGRNRNGFTEAHEKWWQITKNRSRA